MLGVRNIFLRDAILTDRYLLAQKEKLISQAGASASMQDGKRKIKTVRTIIQKTQAKRIIKALPLVPAKDAIIFIITDTSLSATKPTTRCK